MTSVETGLFQACDRLWNLDQRRQWDYIFSEQSYVIEDSPIVRLTHAFFNIGVPFSSTRDLSLLEHMRIDMPPVPKGETPQSIEPTRGIISFASVVPPAVKENPDYVRAVAKPSGIVIQKASATKLSITYLIHLDFGGSLPDFSMTRFISTVFEGLVNIATEKLPTKEESMFDVIGSLIPFGNSETVDPLKAPPPEFTDTTPRDTTVTPETPSDAPTKVEEAKPDDDKKPEDKSAEAKTSTETKNEESAPAPSPAPAPPPVPSGIYILPFVMFVLGPPFAIFVHEKMLPISHVSRRS